MEKNTGDKNTSFGTSTSREAASITSLAYRSLLNIAFVKRHWLYLLVPFVLIQDILHKIHCNMERNNVCYPTNGMVCLLGKKNGFNRSMMKQYH